MKTLWKCVKIATVCGLIAMFGVAGVAPLSSAEEPVKLTWWHLWGGSRAPLIDKLITDYRKTHPKGGGE